MIYISKRTNYSLVTVKFHSFATSLTILLKLGWIGCSNLAAISVGIYKDTCILDLDYPEDRDASVDANIVMTGNGQFVEVQSTGEEATYSKSQLDEMLVLAEKGINELVEAQKSTISSN